MIRMKSLHFFRWKFLLKGFLLLVLLAYTLYMVFIRNTYESFSTLNVDQQPRDKIASIGKPLYKNQKVTGQFTAKENYLGIIDFRFNTFNRINNDQLVFRLKEKNNPTWQVVNKYKTDQFQWNDAYFPFGFPVINNSKGKVYDFSIESLNGRKGNAVAISTTRPQFFTQYVFPLRELVHQPKALIYFLIKKVQFILNEKVFLPIAFLYFLPLIIYIELTVDISGFRLGRKIYSFFKENRKFLITISSIIGFFVYLFLIDRVTGSILFIQLFLWLTLIYVYKFDSRKSFLLALCLLITLPVFILVNQLILADRIAYIIYMTIFVGIIQEVWHYLPLKVYLKRIHEK